VSKKCRNGQLPSLARALLELIPADITLACHKKEHQMKKISAVVIAVLIAVTSVSALAHSGSTSPARDSNHTQSGY
jgi:hypothetical protein